jgi:arylsulfatase A-like enzyme
LVPERRISLLSSVGIGLGVATYCGLTSVFFVLSIARYQWSFFEIIELLLCVTASFAVFSIVTSLVSRRFLPARYVVWSSVSLILLLFGSTLLDAGPAPHTAGDASAGLGFGLLIPLLIVGVTGLALHFVHRVRILVVLFLGFPLGALFSAVINMSSSDRVADGDNVLLVSVDTLRADHVHSKTVRTPHMNALSKQGVRFSNAYAPIAVTGPSHAAMMTGNGPWTTGMLLNGMAIPEDESMLTELFESRKYRTGAFVSAYVLEGDLGFGDHFDVFDDVFRSVKGWDQSGPGRLWGMIERKVRPQAVLERSGSHTVDAALRWMGSGDKGAFFAWVHLFDPHGPYSPPSPWDTASYTGDPRDSAHTSMTQAEGIADYLKPTLEGITDADWVDAQYAGEVSSVDEQIGRLLAWLDSSQIAQNTLVIIVGDHGESLGENDVWFNHGGDLDESAIRVPMMMRYPGRIEPGLVVDAPVGVVDIAPTVRAFFDEEPTGVDGRSLLPVLAGGEVDRPGIRSICYDRVINQQERATGSIERPTYLLSKVWNQRGWVQVGSHMSRGAIQRGAAGQKAAELTVSTLQSIGSGVHQNVDARDQETLDRLKGLGYVE